MKVHRFFRTLVVGLALAALMTPSTRVFGDELKSPLRARQPVHKIDDIVLDAQGNLHGTFIDRQGQARKGSLIVARQGKDRIRTAVTDHKGTFKVAGLNGGIWSVTVGSQSSWLRTWSHNTAPPAARSRLLLIRKAPVVRGQSEGSLLTMFDSGTLFSVGAGVIATTVGVASLTEVSEANDDADSARASAAAANDEAAALRDQLNALGRRPAGDSQALSASTQGPGSSDFSGFIRIDENGNVIDVDGNPIGGQLIYPPDLVIQTLN